MRRRLAVEESPRLFRFHFEVSVLDERKFLFFTAEASSGSFSFADSFIGLVSEGNFRFVAVGFFFFDFEFPVSDFFGFAISNEILLSAWFAEQLVSEAMVVSVLIVGLPHGRD